MTVIETPDITEGDDVVITGGAILATEVMFIPLYTPSDHVVLYE
jgi:hypothetical protein